MKKSISTIIVAVSLALGIACGPLKLGTGTEQTCACFQDPTLNFRCTGPLLQGSQDISTYLDLVQAWAPVIAAGAGHPEVVPFVAKVKFIKCAPPATPVAGGSKTMEAFTG